MASDAHQGGLPDRPLKGGARMSGGADDERTGAWDAASAWAQEDYPSQAEPTPDATGWSPAATASEEHWVEADWTADPQDYAPDIDGYGPDDTPYEGGDDAYYVHDEEGTEYTGVYVPGYGPGGPVGPPPRRHRRRGRGPWPELVIITALAVIAAGVFLVLNKSPHDNTPAASGPSQGAPVTQPGSATSTSTPTTTKATTTTRPPSGSTTANPSTVIAFNVPVNPTWEAGLVTSWVTAEGGEGITAADVEGEVPGKVQFAYTPSDATYWALAEFQPSPTLQAEASTAAGLAKLAFFNNTEYAFSWQDGKTWTLLGEVPTGDCPGIWVPQSVLAAWSMCGLAPPRTPPGA